MAVEHSTEHQLPHGTARVHVVVKEVVEELGRLVRNGLGVGEQRLGVGSARGVGDVVVHTLDLRKDGPVLGAEAGMYHHHDTSLFTRPPKRLPIGIVQRRHAHVMHVPGEVSAGELVVCDPLDLPCRRLDIDAGADSGGNQESIHGEPKVVGRPTVPRSGARLPGF